MSPSDDSRRRGPPPWQPRYALSTLLMVMLVACFTAAAGYYLVRAIAHRDRLGMLAFILYTLSVPTLVLVVVSLARLGLRRWRGRRRGPPGGWMG